MLAVMAENNGADGFAPLRIKRVVRETSDAVSLVLDVPEDCSARFRYEAGQFLTLRVTVDGQDLRRCYSMSSAPVEDDLQITVKRDPGGARVELAQRHGRRRRRDSRRPARGAVLSA